VNKKNWYDVKVLPNSLVRKALMAAMLVSAFAMEGTSWAGTYYWPCKNNVTDGPKARIIWNGSNEFHVYVWDDMTTKRWGNSTTYKFKTPHISWLNPTKTNYDIIYREPLISPGVGTGADGNYGEEMRITNCSTPQKMDGVAGCKCSDVRLKFDNPNLEPFEITARARYSAKDSDIGAPATKNCTDPSSYTVDGSTFNAVKCQY